MNLLPRRSTITTNRLHHTLIRQKLLVHSKPLRPQPCISPTKLLLHDLNTALSKIRSNRNLSSSLSASARIRLAKQRRSSTRNVLQILFKFILSSKTDLGANRINVQSSNLTRILHKPLRARRPLKLIRVFKIITNKNNRVIQQFRIVHTLIQQCPRRFLQVSDLTNKANAGNPANVRNRSANNKRELVMPKRRRRIPQQNITVTDSHNPKGTIRLSAPLLQHFNLILRTITTEQLSLTSRSISFETASILQNIH